MPCTTSGLSEAAQPRPRMVRQSCLIGRSFLGERIDSRLRHPEAHTWIITAPPPSVLTHSFASRFCDGERFFGSAVLCEDRFGAGSPLEGLWVLVSMLDPVVNRGLEFGDVVEGPSSDALASNLGEEPLDEVEPGTGCRREV